MRIAQVSPLYKADLVGPIETEKHRQIGGLAMARSAMAMPRGRSMFPAGR